MLAKAERVTFQRCIKPMDTPGLFVLIGYLDGSDCAFSCVIYAVWITEKEVNRTSLVTSKARVAPDWTKNSVRMELN